jgi:uncharacterized membrane protein (UPF0127 family)
VKSILKKHLEIRSKRVKRNEISLTYILGIILFLAIILFIYLYLYKNDSYEKKELQDRRISPHLVCATVEPKFIKEGKLTFLNKITKKRIKKIDIEIADNYYERAIGLMYRRSMPDTAGMLFVFEQSKPQSFYMKNTYIPLDIIFVDENKQIVTIHKNTKPLSDNRIPSYRDSMYVLEVNAGFCDKYGINIGDYIMFSY